MRDDVRVALDAVPDVSVWEGLDPIERERRAWTLDQIRRRIAEDGPRRAVASPDRGRLFMPFAALEGYEGMIGEAEEDVSRGGSREPQSHQPSTPFPSVPVD